MNKKSLVIVSFAFIFLLALSIISAHEDTQKEKISFEEWLKGLWGKITGKIALSQEPTSTLSTPQERSLCSNALNADGDGFFLPSETCPSPPLPYDCEDRPNGADGIPGNADDGAKINPGATEICGNNIDEDCSGADLVCGTCVTLDNGNNLTLADPESGEFCIDSDVVKEFWCDSQNQLQSSPKSCSQFVSANNFCYQGACTSCVDTDFSAVNFTSFGETYNLLNINNHAKDSCKNSTHLNESSCSGNNVAFQVKDCTQLGAAYSCKNGACSCTPNYIIDACSNDVATFKDASTCGLPSYTASYDCNGDGIVSGPLCAGIENKNVGIDGFEFEAGKNYTKPKTENGTSLVQLMKGNGGGADFNWNFTIGAEPLNFCNISIEVADSSNDFGYTIIKNVSVKNKTVWVERLNKTSGAVCIKDVPGVVSINEFSDNCNGVGEVLVSCPGKNSTYNCKVAYDTPPSKVSWFQVWPLNHSAVKELIFLVSVGAGTSACTENWNCTNWTDLVNQCGTQTCVDLSNCSTTFDKPLENKTCISVTNGGDCNPNWKCTEFGKCTDGFKKRVCTDLENCDDDSSKPNETQNCRKGISPLIIALIVVGLALIIFLIWFFMRKKEDEEEPTYHSPVAPHAPPSPPPRSPPVQTNVYIPRPQYNSVR